MTSKTIKTDVLENAEDYTILRIDILADGARFEGFTQDCALILEDEDGIQNTIEFIEIEDLCNMFEFEEHEHLINYIKSKAVQLNEPGIDFSVQDADIIQEFENFRFSSYNVSNQYKIFKF